MKLHKKFGLCLLVAVAVLLCLLALPQTAHAASESDLTFKLNSTRDGYIVSNCDEEFATGELVIPATYNGLPVTSIGSGAFFGCMGLTNIIIPDSVTSIDSSAFSGCEGLTSITIPDGVTSIGSYAFCECTNLTSITIPGSVTSIGSYAFYDCTSLTSITIPEGVIEISLYVFQYCSSLTSITFPSSVTSIGDNVLAYCMSLTSIQVNENNPVYHSEENCLIETDSKILIAGCKNSRIPSDGSVEKIGVYAFSGCTSLTSITIPEGITSIRDCAFADCTNLTDITISDSVTNIGEWAFNHCDSLTNIIIPDSVTTIDHCAFNSCANLTSVTIGSGVTRIGGAAFYNCSNLTSVVYCGTQEQWDAITMGEMNEPLTNATLQFHNFEGGDCTLCGKNGVIASGTCGDNLTWELYEYGTLHLFGSGAMNNYTSVTTVPWYDYRESIVRVVIDEGCTSIGKHAFSNCANLADVTIPGSVTSIGNYAFHDCSSLTSIVIPEGVTNITDYAFNWCTNLASVTIPSSITKIGEGAFSNCTGVVDLYIADLAAWCKISFRNNQANPIRYAKNLFIAGERVTDLTIPRSITKIGDYAFYSFTGLTSITVSDSLTSIGNYAFDSCNIKKLIIAEGSKEITKTMVMCSATLEEVVIPDSVTSIGYNAFKNCTSLTSATIPDSVTSMSSYAFYGCTSLTSIHIPSGVTSIGSFAFYDCASLTRINIPEGVTHIWDYAFAYCSGLTSIIIPDSVTTIGQWAFTGCTALEDVYITDASAWCKIKFTKYQSYHVQANPLSNGARLHIVDAAGNEVTEIVLDDTVTTIPYQAFNNCINLTAITIPDSVTSIDDSAFRGCVGLTNIAIPDSVTSIGSYAFANCTSLTQLTVDEGNRTYHSAGNCIIETGSKTLIAGCQSSQIPSDGSVTSIGIAAFNSCTKLTSITIPDSVTSIEKSAFNGCSNLSSVIYCGTQEQWDAIEVGDSNEPLLNAALQFHNFEEGICIHCGEIGVLASGTCGEDLTWELFGDGTLIIDGSGKMEDYYFHFMDPNIADPPPWYDIRALIKNIILRSGVTRIGHYAFNGCSNLESVTIPASIESIGIVAFTACFNMEAVYITDLAAWCNIDFDFNYYPEGPAGPNSNPLKWSKKMYLNGEEVKDVVIPDGVTTIKDNAFYFGSFNSITIPSSVQTIGAQAFYDCYVKSIVIPNSVTSIGLGAFGSCSGLEKITYCGTQTQWNAIVKGNDNEPLLNATLQFHSFENGYCSICGQKELAAGDIDGNDEVTYDDAVYLLLHTMFGEELYPLNGVDADIDCNGTVDEEDAVYLLLHTLFGDMFYPLNTPALPSSKEELIG